MAEVVLPGVAAVAPYTLIVNVLVAGLQPPTLVTVMIRVIVAPFVISSVLNVYVGV